MKVPVLLTFIVFVVLVSLTYISDKFLDASFTSYALSIISFVLSAIVSLIPQEIRDFLSKKSRKYDKTSLFGKLLNKLNYIFYKTIYIDLILLILSMMFLSSYFSSSIENTLTELSNRNIIIFPENQNGVYHLTKYVQGSISLPLFLGTLGLYGFLSGFQLRKLTLIKLFISSTVGVVLSILINSIRKGAWTGLIELKKVPDNNNIQFPESDAVLVFLIIGLLMILAFLITFYIWLLSVLAELIRNKIVRLNINDATKEIIVRKLNVPSAVADDILSLKKRISLSDLSQVKGVGKKTLEKARHNFSFDND